MVTPVVTKVASQGSGGWIVAKVNIEKLPGLAQRLRISAVPLMAVFKGRELARQAGAMPASAIRQFIEQASGQGRRRKRSGQPRTGARTTGFCSTFSPGYRQPKVFERIIVEV